MIICAKSVAPAKTTTISAGAAVSKALSAQEVLKASTYLVLSGEESFHWQYQPIHQKKRQSAATQMMSKLAKFLVGSSKTQTALRHQLIDDPRFSRILLAALSPCVDNSIVDPKCQGDRKQYVESLRAFAVICNSTSSISGDILNNTVLPLFLKLTCESNNENKEQTDMLDWACHRLGINNHIHCKSLLRQREDIALPFKVYHGAASQNNSNVFQNLLDEIVFNKELLVLRNGKHVLERRDTCWMAESGIGGMQYSGKVMNPKKIVPSVRRIRDIVENTTGQYFDCCLINLYPDGNCACAMHSDPELGTMWARDSAIVSVGESRKFVFKKISNKENIDSERYSYQVYDGDVILMSANCQEKFEHAVLKSEGVNNNEPRISIVFKRALPQLNGQKGHKISKKDKSKISKNKSSRF